MVPIPPADDQVTSLTAIGGNTKNGPVAFTTTRWSVVLAAQGATPAAQAIDTLPTLSHHRNRLQ